MTVKCISLTEFIVRRKDTSVRGTIEFNALFCHALFNDLCYTAARPLPSRRRKTCLTWASRRAAVSAASWSLRRCTCATAACVCCCCCSSCSLTSCSSWCRARVAAGDPPPGGVLRGSPVGGENASPEDLDLSVLD